MTPKRTEDTDVEQWYEGVLGRVAGGERFAGMYGTTLAGSCRLTVVLAATHRFDVEQVVLRPNSRGRLRFPSLTPTVPSAFWYERAAHDLSGLEPVGHPRLDPLLLPVVEGSARPRPGETGAPADVLSATPEGPVDVTGRGMFTISLGPVRSGVFESIGFLLETPGEDIPHLNIQPQYKHRGIAKRFEGRSLDDGALVAERVEGIASVAHALAFAHAAEAITKVVPPLRAQLLRVVYAELERITNHLDVATRLAEAAGLAVAVSRFAWHKEAVMRLTSRLCGSRFGRGVIVPGGVSAESRVDLNTAVAELRAIHGRIRADAELAMNTPSFLDRLRGTGLLAGELARAWGALGPVGRASGVIDDNRWSRPTDAYEDLRKPASPASSDGADVMARLRVRWSELDVAVQLIVEAASRLERMPPAPLRLPVTLPSTASFGLGWAEGPQGEELYALEVNERAIVRCFARSASLHNLVLFHDVFNGDVFTDFAFIEASFGLGYAGVAM